jgi:hypothetical protein
MSAFGEFRLSISQALTDQLHAALHKLNPAPLSLDEIGALEARQGVYQLYLEGDLVYVGSAAKSLRARLTQHHWKIAGRQNISVEDVGFTCLYVDEDLTVLAPEDRLITVFQDEGSCAWNGQGFGPHDPGRNRDKTILKPDHFDRQYPIRLDWPCEGIKAGATTARHLVRALKLELPYAYRYENKAANRADYDAATVIVPRDNMTALELLVLLAGALPNYQITALMGYVIMYKQRGEIYPDATVIRPAR